MSDLSSTPPPGPPPGPGAHSFGEPLPQPSSPRRGVLVAVVAAVVAAVALPLGAFAVFRALSGGGTQPHEVLPGSALAYFRIDVDPSATQKINALRFLDTFPSFAEVTGIDNPEDDVREVIYDALTKGTGCADVPFSDVDAWLGERMGVAVLPPEGKGPEPGFAVAVQVGDEQAARDGMAELMECGDESNGAGSRGSAADEPGFAYLDGYLVVGATENLAEEHVAAAQEASLAENEQFAADMARLGEPGVASLWVSLDGVVESFQGMLDIFGSGDGSVMAAPTGELATPPGPEGPDPQGMAKAMRQLVADYYSSVAVAFRFEPDHAEVAAAVTGDAYTELEDANSVDLQLPESTFLAVGIADGDRRVGQQWDDMMKLMSDPGVNGGMDPQDMLDQLEAETGLSLPEDLQTLLGSHLAVGLGTEGFEAALRTEDPTRLDVGARVDTDPEAFLELVETVERLAAENGVPLRLAHQEVDGGVVVASNDDYASALAEGGSLNDTDGYQAAVAEPDGAESVVYFDFDQIEDTVLSLAGGSGAGQRVVDNLEPIRGLGVSTRTREGYAEGVLRLTVND
ncbi:MAG: DUF3352 domain-containing protein [Actinomycetota bacterium]|nr:DUF3352 domain-containing protein [Actinomycetota bacterium]